VARQLSANNSIHGQGVDEFSSEGQQPLDHAEQARDGQQRRRLGSPGPTRGSGVRSPCKLVTGPRTTTVTGTLPSVARTSGPEAALYPAVKKWALTKLDCWEVALDTGPSLGRIDVVGIRDFGGGDLASRSEVIAVEVKRSGQPFAKSAGQAHGYSVMADRCYLAQEAATFSGQEQVVASRLGIGLLAITASGRVSEVLGAPVQEPLAELRLKLLEKLSCAVCSICSTVFRVGTKVGGYQHVGRKTEMPGGLKSAAEQKLGLMWWLHETANERDTSGRNLNYWRRYLCADCTRALAPGTE